MRSLSEDLAELISGPLDTVKGFLGEHLKGTVRDLSVILWVIHAAVTLSQVWEDDLDMTLGSEST